MASERVATSPTAVVCAVEQLQARFFEPLSAAELLREAWAGAAADKAVFAPDKLNFQLLEPCASGHGAHVGTRSSACGFCRTTRTRVGWTGSERSRPPSPKRWCGMTWRPRSFTAERCRAIPEPRAATAGRRVALKTAESVRQQRTPY